MVYLCIERSESGAKGTPRILQGMFFLGKLFYSEKKSPKQMNILHIDASFKPSYWPNARSEPFNGLKTACHQLLQTQPLLSFPALFSPPWHKTCVAVYMCLALLFALLDFVVLLPSWLFLALTKL